MAVDTLRTPAGEVAGLLVLDSDGVPGVLVAPAVLLATGGLGQLYQATSNPEVATADGVAIALRSGAPVADIEFVQFHPTVLYTGAGARGRCPLVTEAVRGEGAVLVDSTGARVMAGRAPAGGPGAARRGVGGDHAADGRARRATTCSWTRRTCRRAEFRRRFPTVLAACLTVGVDPPREPIPVAPAAHFACGGVVTTVDGRTGGDRAVRGGRGGADRAARREPAGVQQLARRPGGGHAGRRGGGRRPGARACWPSRGSRRASRCRPCRSPTGTRCSG